MYTHELTDPDDYLPLSGLQHFAFCPRQWALIHLEGQWAENLRTVEGQLLHEKCHDAGERESRGNTLVLRGLRVFSNALGLQGVCDVVEFHRDENGVPLQGRPGRWRPFPVEYKRGKPKEHLADELQLCAQGLCLEEMLCCGIEAGAVFYGETRRRQPVAFSPELRDAVFKAAGEMHRYHKRGHTPKVKPRKGCAQCSLKDICLPGLLKRPSAQGWLREQLGVDTP